MANIKSAKKRIGITARKTEVNKARKSEIKTYIKNFNQSIENNNLDEARELLKLIDKKFKKAVAKNTIHRNTASRKISNLTKKLNSKENKAV